MQSNRVPADPEQTEPLTAVPREPDDRDLGCTLEGHPQQHVRLRGDGALRLEVVARADPERVDGGGRDERDQLDRAGGGQRQGPQIFVRDRDDPAVRQFVASAYLAEGDFSELRGYLPIAGL